MFKAHDPEVHISIYIIMLKTKCKLGTVVGIVAIKQITDFSGDGLELGRHEVASCGVTFRFVFTMFACRHFVFCGRPSALVRGWWVGRPVGVGRVPWRCKLV